MSTYVEPYQRTLAVPICLNIEIILLNSHSLSYAYDSLYGAYLKANYPLEYYATFFSTRCDAFDIHTLLGGYETIRDKILEIRDKLK